MANLLVLLAALFAVTKCGDVFTGIVGITTGIIGLSVTFAINEINFFSHQSVQPPNSGNLFTYINVLTSCYKQVQT